MGPEPPPRLEVFQFWVQWRSLGGEWIPNFEFSVTSGDWTPHATPSAITARTKKTLLATLPRAGLCTEPPLGGSLGTPFPRFAEPKGRNVHILLRVWRCFSFGNWNTSNVVGVSVLGPETPPRLEPCQFWSKNSAFTKVGPIISSNRNAHALW